ncbi:uncharacterized protein LOC135937474 [Cloeon dipterum]|uniref:uncharacterized protein LOC135937474 n=1 Tax=Cloeon dipterum TaxID=197152 RepID=UPI003220398C
MTWLSSFKQCSALGMETLNIDNAAEQLGLTNMTNVYKDKWKANFNYWTSGKINKGSPERQWSFCESTGPTIFAPGLKWEAGQPDNTGGSESCVHFRFVLNDTGTTMSDRNCTNKYIFACKMQIEAPAQPCVASCPSKICQRNPDNFIKDARGNSYLIDYMNYGSWYDGCGRNILAHNSTMLSWAAARDKCCDIGLTLASMETAGKLSCFSKITTKYAPYSFGDFWLSGTDLNCPSNFRWCSLGRDFVDSELKWKTGHPKADLDCVYLEVRNRSLLLASANCAENKTFLCEVRKKATAQRAMQTECAEIWDITSDQIDLLMNVSAFLSADISFNLKCFLKCVGIEIGIFDIGALNSIATLRQIEFVSQEEPEKLEHGFVAYDTCSGRKFDDECVTAYETYKCGLQEAPDLVSNIISNNFDNNSILSSPTPCVPLRRTCWLSDRYPCIINQTAIDRLNSDPNKRDDQGKWVTLSNNRTYYFGNPDGLRLVNPVNVYKHCCELGLKFFEPETVEEIELFLQFSYADTFVGETVSVNQTHEAWCHSRVVLPDSLFANASQEIASRYACFGSIVGMSANYKRIKAYTYLQENFVEYYYNNQSSPMTFFATFVCVKP